jgi:hypothetical protein
MAAAQPQRDADVEVRIDLGGRDGGGDAISEVSVYQQSGGQVEPR